MKNKITIIIFYFKKKKYNDKCIKSILSQTFFMRGVELIGSNQAGIYVNLVPIFTALIAIVLLSETIHIFHIIALFLVLSGIYITEKYKVCN